MLRVMIENIHSRDKAQGHTLVVSALFPAPSYQNAKPKRIVRLFAL